ncbi:MAG: sugar ABC transporter permease [Armatimonadota bacterium]|nr:MAG: sugar ABC transporter permease [Armatimonadota bacterium]
MSDRTRSVRKTALWKAALTYLVLGLGAVTMLVPFYWMVLTSLQPPEMAFSMGQIRWIPERIVWQNYPEAWKAIDIPRLYWNSIVVAVLGTLGQVLTSSLAAFAFARLEFPGRDRLFFAYLATMMVPGSVTMIPNFVLLRWLGWIDTYQALIIPGMFSAYGTFLLRQFFMGLPTELEDAAKIDGSSYAGIWARVTLPLSRPALATLTTFTFMGFWGAYMWPLIIIQSPELRTLPIGLASFVGRYSAEYSLWMAASVIALIPVLLLFIFNQRYFQEGIKMSGIKG